MSTKTKNVALFTHVNEGWLQQVGRDGQYNRDRLFKQIGVQPGPSGDYSRVHLSDAQRKAMAGLIESELGLELPKGIEVDQAGNINEDVINKGTVAKRVGIGAAIGGAALTGLGAAGIGPLSGLLGGGAAAAGGAGAASAAGAGTAAGTAATTAGVGGAIAGAAKAAAPSVFQRILGAAAPALGSAADTMAGNRGTRAEMSLAAELANQTGSREERESRNDAQANKPVLVQALVAKLPVEALHVRVLDRLAGSNETQRHAVGISPRIQRAASKLRRFD